MCGEHHLCPPRFRITDGFRGTPLQMSIKLKASRSCLNKEAFFPGPQMHHVEVCVCV